MVAARPVIEAKETTRAVLALERWLGKSGKGGAVCVGSFIGSHGGGMRSESAVWGILTGGWLPVLGLYRENLGFYGPSCLSIVLSHT